MNEERITYFAETDARSKKVPFGIKAKDRTRHVYVIGKTGMGKSTLLENMAVQDIKNGEGMAFIDPHGKTADLLLEYVPPERVKDVIYFAPFDTNFPISFNVLESVDPDKRHLVVSGLMSTFKKIWADAWSARMEYILTNTLLALLEYPGATLLGVNRMLGEKDFRKDVIDHVTDISVKNFWVKEFANYTERMAAEAIPSIQNKIGQFTANALVRNMIGQPHSSFDIRAMMDSKKILIINLSKGRIGESNANLLGGMLITKIYLAALSRADVPERVLRTMPNFYLYVDEFQSFANESFADILSEARKYKLNLTIAHQYIEQMEEEVRAAVFGNVGTMIIFRVGAYDAEVLEKEFAPVFTAEDIVNLGAYQIYLKLMIDGISSSPFSASSLPLIALPPASSMEAVIASSREQFAHNRADVEKTIVEWHQPIVKKAPAPIAPSSSPTSASAYIPPQPAQAPYSAPTAAVAKPPAYVPPSAPQYVPRPAPQPVMSSQSAPQHAAQSAPRPVSRPVREAPRRVPAASKPVPVSATDATPTPTHTPASAPIPPTKPAPVPPMPTPDPVSLSALSKNTPRAQTMGKNDQKAPTPKNVNDLKSALASIMGGGSAEKSPAPKAKADTKEKEKPTVLKNADRETQEESPKEVPKDVLEKMLKV